MNLRFFSLPAHELLEQVSPLSRSTLLEPEVPADHDLVERALTGAEFRDMRAGDRAHSLLERDGPNRMRVPVDARTPSAIFAQPPGDLPALLRLADQLEVLARDEEGERALVWKCAECSTRYAVPVTLVRPVSIRCERCGHSVELRPERSVGEEALMDPARSSVNIARRQLAAFFRESMARGWPVLVSSNA